MTGNLVCVACRNANSTWHCQTCGAAAVSTSYRWRPPTKNNERAWKMIEAGDWLWDKRAVAARKWGKEWNDPATYERIREAHQRRKARVDAIRAERALRCMCQDTHSRSCRRKNGFAKGSPVVNSLLTSAG